MKSETKVYQLGNGRILECLIRKEELAPRVPEGPRAWIRSFYVPTSYRGIPYEGRHLFPFWLLTIFDPSKVCDAQGFTLKGTGISPIYHEMHHDSSLPWIASVGGMLKCDLGGTPLSVEAYAILDNHKVRHLRFDRIMNINGLKGKGDEYTFGLWCIDYERSMPFFDYITFQWNVCLLLALVLPRGMPEGETFKLVVRDKLDPETVYLQYSGTKDVADEYLVYYEYWTFIELTEKPESISLTIETYRPETSETPADTLDLEGGFTPPYVENKKLLYALLGVGSVVAGTGATLFLTKKRSASKKL